MIMRTRIAVASALLLLAGPALAQGHKPDPTARRVFGELVKSYRKRPALTVRTVLKIDLVQGETKSPRTLNPTEAMQPRPSAAITWSAKNGRKPETVALHRSATLQMAVP